MYEELDMHKGMPNNYSTPAYQQGIVFYKGKNHSGLIYSLIKIPILVFRQYFI